MSTSRRRRLEQTGPPKSLGLKRSAGDLTYSRFAHARGRAEQHHHPVDAQRHSHHTRAPHARYTQVGTEVHGVHTLPPPERTTAKLATRRNPTDEPKHDVSEKTWLWTTTTNTPMAGWHVFGRPRTRSSGVVHLKPNDGGEGRGANGSRSFALCAKLLPSPPPTRRAWCCRAARWNSQRPLLADASSSSLRFSSCAAGS